MMFDNKSLLRLLFVSIFLLILLFLPGEQSIAESNKETIRLGDGWDSLSFDVIDPEDIVNGGDTTTDAQSCISGGGDIPLDEETYQHYLQEVEYPKGLSRAVLPASYDARDDDLVTSPKNQGTCGSCWAFASVGAMESHLKALGVGGTEDYSEQQLVSCNSSGFGCCVGGNSTAIQFWESTGPITESCFAYGESSTTCPTESTVPCSSASGCTQLNYRVVNYHTVSESQFKDSLYIDGPSYWRFSLYDDFYSFYNNASSGSVYVNTSESEYDGGHAVLLIGWSDSKGAYLAKNSWGATSGPQGDGTFWIAYSGHAHDLGFQMANFDLVAVGTGDSYEPDNSDGEANWIVNGSPQTHSIVPVGDEDWVKFTLTSESEVTLETSGASGDTRMWLYDSGLTQVDFNDDGGSGLFSHIDRVCEVDALPAGTYYVKVDEYFNDDQILSYDLSFSASPCQSPYMIFLPVLMKSSGDTDDFNGDFELGHTSWTEYSSSGNDLITSSMPVTPHSGTWLAKFGENNEETDQLSQVLTVPADRTDLHYWYWIPTADTHINYDFFDVKINGTVVHSIDLYETNITTGWVEDVVDLSPYAGLPVTLMFEVTTDTSSQSTLYMDDVSFKASGFNGDFELGHTSWTEYSSSTNELITDTMPVTPHSGTWLAKFGENNDETDQLSQIVSVPPGSDYLHYRYWIDSEDACSYDYFRVKINGGDHQIFDLCSTQNTEGWVEGLYNISAYAGTTITLMFEVTTDFSYESTLYLDDVAFISTGTSFNSQFNGDATGWEVHSGTWYISDNYYWTYGSIGTFSSVSYAEYFGNFDYQVQMWRYGNDYDATHIIVRGTPYPQQTYNLWSCGYIFQYTREGKFSVFKLLSDGSIFPLQSWTSSAAINTGNAWNTLRVVATGSNFYYYINGTLVWSGSDPSYASGRVGIGMYREDDAVEDDALDIDWATLTTLPDTSLFEADTVSAEQQLLNETANQNPVGDFNGTE